MFSFVSLLIFQAADCARISPSRIQNRGGSEWSVYYTSQRVEKEPTETQAGGTLRVPERLDRAP